MIAFYMALNAGVLRLCRLNLVDVKSSRQAGLWKLVVRSVAEVGLDFVVIHSLLPLLGKLVALTGFVDAWYFQVPTIMRLVSILGQFFPALEVQVPSSPFCFSTILLVPVLGIAITEVVMTKGVLS